MARLVVIAIIVFYVLACLRDPAAAPSYQPNNAYAGQPNAELGNIKHDGSQQPFVGGQPQGYGQPQYGAPPPAQYQQ